MKGLYPASVDFAPSARSLRTGISHRLFLQGFVSFAIFMLNF
jgi:hypothetical protein